jgi:hypothetical protein
MRLSGTGVLHAIGLVLLLSMIVLPAWAHSGDLLSSYGTAVIDGVVSAGEYGSCIGPFTQGIYTVTICETNDFVNDYYAVTVLGDTTNNAGDNAQILFDNNHDGTVINCQATGREDTISVIGDGSFLDRNYCFLSPGNLFTVTDGVSAQHGTGARTFTANVGYVFEMSHPLNSGDSNDHALATGSTVGWCLSYVDFEDLQNFVQYPSGCLVTAQNDGDASLYGNIFKRGAPPAQTPVGGELLAVNSYSVVSPWLAMIAVLATAVVISLTRRKE